MKEKDSANLKGAFAEAVEEVARRYRGVISPEAAEEVFQKALVGWPEVAVSESASGGWTGRISSDVVQPLVPREGKAQGMSESSLPSVCIRIDTHEMMESILHQVLQIGAILVELSPAPSLNQTVVVSLEFPQSHLFVETQGRVVHQSNRGTAIEVSGLGKEDRLAFEAIRDDLENQKLREKKARRKTKPGLGPSVHDSYNEPGVIPPVQEQEPEHSFAVFASRKEGLGRPGSTTSNRKRVDLPDPDMNVAESTRREAPAGGKTTREFYGPAPEWFEPGAGPDRIEELAGERVLDILLQLSESGFTGMLEFVGEQGQEQYLFDGGYVVERAAEPRVALEELGPMLKAADKISKRQLAMAAAHADEFGLTVARSLMDLDILSPEVLRHAIAGRLIFLLREFCKQGKGELLIYGSRSLPAGFLPQPPLRVHVAVERVIYDRLFRSLNQLTLEERERRMANELDAYPEVLSQEADRLERAVTQPEQRRLLDRVVTGRKRLREVLTESPLSPGETFAAVFSLHRMGLLRFDRSLHATVVRERMRENVTVKYLSVHKASYFEVLNVHWSSYSEVIEKAYRELKEQFQPVKVPAELEEEVHQRVREINDRIEAAYAALAKRETRHAYRTRIMPEYKLAHAIPLFMKQSELAERRGQWAEARDGILRVLEIEPGHAEASRRLTRLNQIIDGGILPDPSNTNQ